MFGGKSTVWVVSHSSHTRSLVRFTPPTLFRGTEQEHVLLYTVAEKYASIVDVVDISHISEYFRSRSSQKNEFDTIGKVIWLSSDFIFSFYVLGPWKRFDYRPKSPFFSALRTVRGWTFMSSSFFKLFWTCSAFFFSSIVSLRMVLASTVSSCTAEALTPISFLQFVDR